MKKILTTFAVITASLLITSCWNNSEEQKIIDDLDLEIQEFLDQDPEIDWDKIEDEKDKLEIIENKIKKTSTWKIITTDPETNLKTEELTKNDKTESKNIEITKTIEEFTKCITKNWAKAYWTSWCSHCQKQKEMFWDASKYLNFTDCDADRKWCKDAWITWYPTWVINWEQFPWVQSFEKLWEKTWCKLAE